MDKEVIIIDIDKDVIKKNNYKRYSENSILEVIINENDEEVDLSNYTATVYFKMPKGDILIRECNIIDNKINIIIDEVLLSENGKIYFEIRLDNSIQIVTTFLRYLEIIG